MTPLEAWSLLIAAVFLACLWAVAAVVVLVCVAVTRWARRRHRARRAHAAPPEPGRHHAVR